VSQVLRVGSLRILRHLDSQMAALECQIERLAQKTICNPSSVNVHDLRVCIRRMRAVLWICREGAPRIHLRRFERDLHDLGREWGKVRELDVAIEDSRRFDFDVRELKSLRAKKKGKAVRELEAFKNRYYSKTSSRRPIIRSGGSHFDFERVRGVLKREMNHWRKNKLNKLSRLHRLRVEVKNLRYRFEALGFKVGQLPDLQKLLGRTHDLEVLMELQGRKPKIKREQRSYRESALNLAGPSLRFARSACQ